MELAEKERAGEAEKAEKKVDEDTCQFSFSGNPRLFTLWDSNVPIDDALKELDSNLSAIGDFSLDSKVKPEEAIEHFASQYTIYKQHIQKNGTEEQLKALDFLLEKHVEKYARDFSEVVGGFFENNGVQNERKNIYESLKNRVTRLIDCFDNYISNNSESFQKILDNSEADGKCATFEFLAAYKKDGDMETFTRGSKIDYTRQELAGATELVRIAGEILTSGKAGIESEEELGVRFGQIAINGLVALRVSTANGEHKDVFFKAVKSRVDDLIAESDKLLENKRLETDEKAAYAPLNRDSIYSIVNSIMERYKETKSADDALAYGKKQGLAQYLSKAGSNAIRYQYSSYGHSVKVSTVNSTLQPLNKLA